MAQSMARFRQICLIYSGQFLSQPFSLALLPALCLGLYWSFGEIALIIAACIIPVVVFASWVVIQTRTSFDRDALTGLATRDAFERRMSATFDKCQAPEYQSAIYKIEIDDHKLLLDRHGQVAFDHILAVTAERVEGVFRTGDCVAHWGDLTFAVCLQPVKRLDLEICIQMAGRVQQAVQEPVSIDGTAIYVSASVGFCLSSRMGDTTPQTWVEAARMALHEAQFHGPSAIRAYSEEMRRRHETQSALRDDLAEALESGQIQPWYQPQISTDTGLVSGFEALARWQHPTRGLVPPSEFLPAIEQAGLLERLAEVMMFNAFGALKAWDAAGVTVPQVGVNFAGPELSNPKLVDKIMWELDRFELTPDRLAVEVLETVVASAPDDVVARNINGLCRLGCKIDLDDFGTGHASITSIRRFSVNRIKIDRSFVMKADRDPEQQRMVSAILTMAERMDVETLAEGVETVGEHALLAQLGCNHVQGFGIARPMPFDRTIEWITAHNAKLEETPRIMGNKS